MGGPTTEVLNEDLKDLRKDIRALEIGLTKITTQIDALFSVAKLGIGLVASTVLGGIVAGIWWSGGINADVRNFTADVRNLAANVHDLTMQVAEVRKAADEQKLLTQLIMNGSRPSMLDASPNQGSSAPRYDKGTPEDLIPKIPSPPRTPPFTPPGN